MKLLVVVTTPCIYHGCSTRKTLWEGKFTGKENLFLAVIMKNCGRQNVKEHKEIKGSYKYVTLDIPSKFESLDKMKITSSESKGKLERSGKGLINSLGFKAKARLQKKARYAIRNISKKDISKILKDFEKIEKLPFKKKRPKHEPTESYFHLSRQLAKCIMRSDTVNWYDHGGYTKMTAPYSNVNVTNEGESKRSIVNEKSPKSCSMNENESKRSIVNKTLSQNCTAKEN